MSARNFYRVQEAMQREIAASAASDTTEDTGGPTAQEIVEDMTIVEAREALIFADASIRGFDESKARAIAAKKFIKDQLFREVE